jgi:hypothetical protein
MRNSYLILDEHLCFLNNTNVLLPPPTSLMHSLYTCAGQQEAFAEPEGS